MYLLLIQFVSLSNDQLSFYMLLFSNGCELVVNYILRIALTLPPLELRQRGRGLAARRRLHCHSRHLYQQHAVVRKFGMMIICLMWTSLAITPVAAMGASAQVNGDLLVATATAVATVCMLSTSVRVNNPYRHLRSTLFTHPGNETLPVITEQHNLDPATGIMFGEQQNDYGDELWNQLKEVATTGLFAPENGSMSGNTTPLAPFDIEFEDESVPCHQKPRNYSELENRIMDEHFGELAELSYIERAPPDAMHANPLVVVAKKLPDGTWGDKRVCLDARAVNARTKPFRTRTETPEAIHNRMFGSKFFSKFDMKSGFYQIHLTERAKAKMAFYWRGKVWRYTRMPFGARNAPAAFQDLMDFVLRDCVREDGTRFAEAYIDDVVVHSPTPEQHIKDVEFVLKAFHNANLYMHKKKSVFGTAYTEFLGFMLSPNKLTPAAAKVKAISELPEPKSIGDLRAAIGLCNYYRCFDPDFAQSTAVLNSLLRGGGPSDWKNAWSDEHSKAFQDMKAKLLRPNLAVRLPDPSKEYFLHCDFSGVGIGAVLSQYNEEGQEVMIACISRTLNKHERNYPSFEGEMLAVVYAVRTFRQYLWGRKFKVITDHKPLTFLKNQKDLTSKHARWAATLAEFDYEVEHRPGQKHQNADVPSRHPLPTTADTSGARLDVDEEVEDYAICNMVTSQQDELSQVSCYLSKVAVSRSEQDIESVKIRATMRTLTAAFYEETTHADHETENDFHEYQHPDAMLAKSIPSNNYKRIMTTAAQWIQECPPSMFEESSAIDRMGEDGVYYQLDTKPVGKYWNCIAEQRGITLIELYGGIGAGLEALLKCGYVINKYIHCDIDTNANTAIEHRLLQFSTEYPHLFSLQAVWRGNENHQQWPEDVNYITRDMVYDTVHSDQGAIIVIAGWPCQDLSAAGRQLGLQGERSGNFYRMINILGEFQSNSESVDKPFAYIVENVPFQYDRCFQQRESSDFREVSNIIGRPVTFDAAQVGSRAYRLRNYWTNLSDNQHLAGVIQRIERDDSLLVSDVIRCTHRTQLGRDEPYRLYSCNKPKQPLRALPTLVVAQASYAFREKGAGVLTDSKTGEDTEPNAMEREMAMGYEYDTTAAPGLSNRDRCRLLGNAMDLNALVAIISISKQLAIHYDYPSVTLKKDWTPDERAVALFISQLERKDTGDEEEAVRLAQEEEQERHLLQDTMGPRTLKSMKDPVEGYGVGCGLLLRDGYQRGKPLGLGGGIGWPVQLEAKEIPFIGLGYTPKQDDREYRKQRQKYHAEAARAAKKGGVDFSQEEKDRRTLELNKIKLSQRFVKVEQESLVIPNNQKPFDNREASVLINSELEEEPNHCLQETLVQLAELEDTITVSVSRAMVYDERSDPYQDQELMSYMKGTSIAEVSADMSIRRRVMKRAQAYEYNNDQLKRKFLDGSTRIVPEPEVRLTLIKDIHSKAGHFGEKRTAHLVGQHYYWPKVKGDVHQVVSGCQKCKRIQTAFTAEDPVLHPLPIKGLCYRWGIDLMKLPKSKLDFERVMVCVEHMSRLIILIPLKDKSAVTTAHAFRNQILSLFGAPAEVLTDNGTEWQAEFDDMLTYNSIDHRSTATGRAQSNGLAERIVQVVKKSLAKISEDPDIRNHWENHLAAIQMAYNASPQAGTKLAPMTVMFAQAPTIPPAVKERYEQYLEFTDDEQQQDELAQQLIERSQLKETAEIVASKNLLIAQHRDQIRYARTHGGQYIPSNRIFKRNDYVYLKRERRDVLEPRTRKEVLRIQEISGAGMATLIGSDRQTVKRHVNQLAPCRLTNIDPAFVPLEEKDDICEVCKKRSNASKMLLCDKCDTGWHTFCLTPKLNEIPEFDWYCPRCRNTQPMAKGQSTNKSTVTSKLSTTAKSRTPVLHDRRASTEVKYGSINSFTVRTDQLPVRYDTATALERLIQVFMPGEWHSGHITKLFNNVKRNQSASAALNALPTPLEYPELPNLSDLDLLSAKVISRVDLKLPLIVTMPKEVLRLVREYDLSLLDKVYDPWSGTGVISKVLMEYGCSVITNDIHPSAPAVLHKDAIQLQTYQQWQADTGIDAIVTSPHFALLDIALPMAVRMVKVAAFIHCPAAYYTDAPDPRWNYFEQLRAQGLLHILWHLPHGPQGRRCIWMCIFRSPADQQKLARH